MQIAGNAGSQEYNVRDMLGTFWKCVRNMTKI